MESFDRKIQTKIDEQEMKGKRIGVIVIDRKSFESMIDEMDAMFHFPDPTKSLKAQYNPFSPFQSITISGLPFCVIDADHETIIVG